MTYDVVTTEFVDQVRSAVGDNLLSIVLFGSAADGEFHPEYSDLNFLCLVRSTSFSELAAFAPVVAWWRKKKHHPPLVITPEELKSSAAEFSIEFLDIKQRYRVLHGQDLLQELQVPMAMHRFQLKYEFREKLFLVRRHVLLAANEERQLWEVMLHSLSSFTTLFRHVLLEMDEQERKHSRDAVTELASRMNFDPAPFVQLMDVRAGKLDRKQLNAGSVCAQYLSAIEKVAAAVDTMQSHA